MSIRTISGAAIATALLALPSVASARPAEQVDTGPFVAGTPLQAEPADTHVTSPADGGGAGTLTVLAIAGGTLLVGAAGGFGGARAATRRQAVHG